MSGKKEIKSDVVVIGSGIIGLALCARLVQSGCSVTLVDRKLPEKITGNTPIINPSNQAWVSALARHSTQLLDQIGIWSYLKSHNATPYQSMKVVSGSGAKFGFSNQDIHQENLGFIVNNELMKNALWRFINQPDHRINLICDEPEKWCQQSSRLLTQGGICIQANLLVGADGVHSWARKNSGINLIIDQSSQDNAWVGLLTHADPHRNTARQVFYATGVIGLLPTQNPNQSVCVWSSSCHIINSNSVQCASEGLSKLSSILNHAFQHDVYRIEGSWRCHKIYSQSAAHYYRNNMVLVGDAFASVHPLAGQGLNLGLRQVSVLSNIIVKLIRREDYGNLNDYLHNYAKACRGYDALSHQVIRGCRRYLTQAGFLGTALGVASTIFDYASPFKKLFIEHALEGNMLSEHEVC